MEGQYHQFLIQMLGALFPEEHKPKELLDRAHQIGALILSCYKDKPESVPSFSSEARCLYFEECISCDSPPLLLIE